MKFKSAAIGLLVSAAVAAPVVQAVNLSFRPTATSVVAYETLPANGEVFANWSSQFRNWILTFGVVNATQPSSVGLRISAPSSQRANSWSMDVDTTAGALPFFQTFAILPGNNLPQLASFVDANALDPNYTSQPIPRSIFRRVRFNAQTGLPAGSSFSTIYFGDTPPGPGSSFRDVVKNALVNGAAVTPSLQPNPEFDSALSFL